MLEEIAAARVWEQGVDAMFFGPTGEVKQSNFVIDLQSGFFRRTRIGGGGGPVFEKADRYSGK